MSQQSILSENLSYWTGRAAGYSAVNQLELSTAQRQTWSDCLRAEIERQFPSRAPESLQVLDIGTGPGFFAILLAGLGYRVTAVDLTRAMLYEAQKNAGAFADRIQWIEGNAQALCFPDRSFDVVVSRNLTWNLPQPARAYAEWARVLKDGGLLLNFDANWYAYLFDEQARAAYDRDRVNSAEEGVADQNVGEGFDVMEDIARRVPLSRIRRPGWDLRTLQSFGLEAQADEQIWQRVWSAEEKLNFSSTPLFLVRALRK